MFLFKGWTPAFIRLGPNTVLLFVFFEVCALLSFFLLQLTLLPALTATKERVERISCLDAFWNIFPDK